MTDDLARIAADLQAQDAAEARSKGLLDGNVSGNGAAPSALADSWDPIDLGPVMAGIADGTIERPTPTIGIRTDGAGIFYSARLNAVFGRYGSQKSFVALIVALQQIQAGHPVWWVDFEDHPTGIAERLVDLGADPSMVSARLVYLNPHESLDPVTAATVLARLRAQRPGLVVIDSTGEWMGLHHIESHKDEQVAAFYKTYLGPFTRAGAAVVGLDHVPHEAADKLRAIGSQRKQGAVTGVAYLCETLVELGRGRIGRARLISGKDRCGTYPRGATAAELTIDATATPYTVTLAPPADRSDDGPLPDEKPAVRRVLAALTKADHPIGTTALGDLLAGDGTTGTGLKKRTVQDALKRLGELGLARIADTDHYGGHMWAATPSGDTP